MTICITAVGTHEGKDCIVFATDHMVTSQNGQFEQNISKYKELMPGKIVGMLAGQALLSDELFKLDASDDDLLKIRSRLHKNFTEMRKTVIQREILEKFNVDLDFIRQSLNQKLQFKIMLLRRCWIKFPKFHF